MGFASDGARIWPVTPDWKNGIQERLAWSTEILTASATATTQHRSIQSGPRRDFTFELAAPAQERRVAEMLLAGHRGTWLLPIWPDVQWLAQGAAPLGADTIACNPAGRDFAAGGKALLYTSVNRWEVVEIDAIESDHLALSGATTAAYSLGSRVYPLRRARPQNGAEERLRGGDFGRRSITFDIAEPCDWPELVEPAQYLGHLALMARPDESDDLTSSVSRLLSSVDYGTSLPFVHDLPGVALRAQQSHWKLFGRAEHTWFRSLVYTLDGRRVPIWVPSFADDLKPAYPVVGGGTTLSVEWAGYAQFGLARPNRRDLRIELDDGTVHLRRITGAAETGDTEALALSAPLDGASIAPERIRQVSFLALCTLASDTVEIEHVTDADGTATSTTGWQAVVPDV